MLQNTSFEILMQLFRLVRHVSHIVSIGIKIYNFGVMLVAR